MPTLKAEVRKLLTVRSTYAMAALAAVVAAGMSFYLAARTVAVADLGDRGFVANAATSSLALAAIMGTIVAVLAVTHEYRYHLLLHSLTASNSRTNVLAAKVAVVSGFAIVVTLVVDAVSLASAFVGAHIAHGDALASQTIEWGDVLWRTLLFGWGYAIAGLAIALLVRNQVAAMVTVFLLFGPVEAILDAVLGDHAYLLPFTALGNVLGSKLANTALVPVTPARAAAAFAVDIAVLLGVAWRGFVRRDASA